MLRNLSTIGFVLNTATQWFVLSHKYFEFEVGSLQKIVNKSINNEKMIILKLLKIFPKLIFHQQKMQSIAEPEHIAFIA